MPPFEVENPLAAAGAFANAFYQTQQDQKEKELARRRQDQLDQAAAMNDAWTQERERTNLDLAKRKQGVGITLPEKMGKVSTNATLEQRAQHASNLANWYLQQGATDIAGKYEQDARELFTAAHQSRADAERFERDASFLAEKIRSDKVREGIWSRQADENMRHHLATEAQAIRRGDQTYEAAMASVNERYYSTDKHAATSITTTGMREAGQNAREQYRITNQNIYKEYQTHEQQYRNSYKEAAIAIRTGKPLPPGWSIDEKKNQLVGPPQIMAPRDFEAELREQIDAVRKDPRKLHTALTNIEKDASLTRSMKSEATLVLHSAATRGGGGGSNAALPFQRSSGLEAPPALQAEIEQVRPQLRAVIDALPQIVPGATVTSVIGGPHKGSAHADRRAVDIAPPFMPGLNEATWQAITRLVLSGRVQAIGTEGSIANNPRAKAWCAQHGVNLFEDDTHTGATGAHMHIQVAH